MIRVSQFAYLAPFFTTITTPALAQSDAAPAEASDAGSVLEEIIVTAQQRDESLQAAALPISVVTGAELQKSGIGGLDSLGKNVPSLQVINSSQGNLVFIRGVGSFSFQPSSDPAAAFNYDGVYVGRSSSTAGAFFDLERVEVLKGPQGTLYGRNATAGAINVIPVQPRLGETSGYATASYGNYDAWGAEGAINAPLGEQAAFRLSAVTSSHDGYLSDGTGSDRSWAVRAQAKVEFDPTLTMRLSADYSHQGGSGTGVSYIGQYVFNPTTQSFVVTPASTPVSEGLYTSDAQALRQASPAGTIPGRFQDALAVRPYADNEIYGVQAQIDWLTPIGTLTVIPAWRHGLKDILNVGAGQPVGNVSESDQTSIEARLVSDTGGLFDYIVGAYYFDERIEEDVHNTAGGQAAFNLPEMETRSPAVYGRLTLHASEAFRITGGVRYTRESKDFTSRNRQLLVICTIPAAAGGCPSVPLIPYTERLEDQPVLPATSGATLPLGNGGVIRRTDVTNIGELRDEKVTWRGALELDVAPRSMLYASAETGYRAGGFNPDAPYGSESITAYTVGSKNRFLDNTLQLNVEGFHWKYRDQQLSFLGINSLGVPGAITRNIGRATSQGVEVEALMQVTSDTRLMANVQYLDTEYDEFVYTTPTRPYMGCDVTPSGTLFSVDCSGNPMYNAPEWTTILGVQQRFAFRNGLDLVLDADTQYRSGRFTNFDFTPQEYQDANWISNAQLSLVSDGGKWSVAAFVRNIENDRYQTYAGNVAASNLIVSLNAPPRTYGIRLSKQF